MKETSRNFWNNFSQLLQEQIWWTSGKNTSDVEEFSVELLKKIFWKDNFFYKKRYLKKEEKFKKNCCKIPELRETLSDKHAENISAHLLEEISQQRSEEFSMKFLEEFPKLLEPLELWFP